MRSPRPSPAAQLSWLRRLRWCLWGGYLALGVVLFSGVLLERRLAVPFLGLLLAHGIFLVAGELRAARGRPFPLLWVLSVDLVVVTGVLVAWGGTENPLAALLLLYAVLGAWLLDGAKSGTFLLACGASLVALTVLRGVQTVRGDALASALLFPVVMAALGTALWAIVRGLRQAADDAAAAARRIRAQRRRLEGHRLFTATAAQLAHRIASPLATAQLLVERLQRQAASLPDVAATSQRLERAIAETAQALRAISSEGAQGRAGALEDVALAPLVAATVEAWAAKRKPASVVTVETSGTARVRAPRQPLVDALSVLLDNAADAAGSAPIVIVLEDAGGDVVLSVVDAGPGVADEVLERVGEPFVTTRANGNGLGLFQCASLADALGGEFRLRNRRRGAEASLILPRLPAANSEARNE